MKAPKVRQYLFAIALLPVVVIELIVVSTTCGLSFLDKLLMKCRFYLTGRAVFSAQGPPAANKEERITAVLHMWNAVSNRDVAEDRKLFENTGAGRRAVKSNPDRHLYAVTRPSRSENIQRIRNVLLEMPPEQLNGLLARAENHPGQLKLRH